MNSFRELYETLEEAVDRGQFALTRHLCELALKEKPDNAGVLMHYASCLTNLRSYEEAHRVLAHAESVFPAKYRHLVLSARGHCLEEQGQFEDAEAAYMEAHALSPNKTAPLTYAAAIAFRRGDIKRAEKLARRAVNTSDGCKDEACYNLAGYLLVQTQYEEARGWYQRTLEIDPGYEAAKKRLAELDCMSQMLGA